MFLLSLRAVAHMLPNLQEYIRGTVVEDALQHVNAYLAAYEPWQVAVLSVAAFIVVQTLWHFFVVEEEPVLRRAKRSFFAAARKIPFVRDKIASELAPLKQGFEKSMLKTSANKPLLTALPQKGASFADINKQLDSLRSISPLDKRVEEFKVSAGVIENLNFVRSQIKMMHVVCHPYVCQCVTMKRAHCGPVSLLMLFIW